MNYSGNGYGYGYGNGNGHGHGHGDGDGNGDGHGSGYGDGNGYGHGEFQTLQQLGCRCAFITNDPRESILAAVEHHHTNQGEKACPNQ